MDYKTLLIAWQTVENLEINEQHNYLFFRWKL